MPPETKDPDSWERQGQLVLASLDRLEKNVHSLRGSVNALTMEVAMLRVKAGIWGALAGGIPAVIVGVVIWLMTKGH